MIQINPFTLKAGQPSSLAEVLAATGFTCSQGLPAELAGIITEEDHSPLFFVGSSGPSAGSARDALRKRGTTVAGFSRYLLQCHSSMWRRPSAVLVHGLLLRFDGDKDWTVVKDADTARHHLLQFSRTSRVQG